MSLPESWIQRIFDRMDLTYGHQFLARWDGMQLDKVKELWGHDLAGFAQHPSALWWALEHLPTKHPPTSIEFRALAREAPTHQFADPAQPRLAGPQEPEQPKADEALVRQEMEKLRADPTLRGGDQREWARAIVARHRVGEKATPTVLAMALAALGLDVPASQRAQQQQQEQLPAQPS